MVDMTADIVIPQGSEGDPIQFKILNEDGSPDDLTVYASIQLKVYKADFLSTPIIDTTNNITVTVDGTAEYTTQVGDFDTPAKYFAHVIRNATNVTRPTTKFTIEVTQLG